MPCIIHLRDILRTSSTGSLMTDMYLPSTHQLRPVGSVCYIRDCSEPTSSCYCALSSVPRWSRTTTLKFGCWVGQSFVSLRLTTITIPSPAWFRRKIRSRHRVLCRLFQLTKVRCHSTWLPPMSAHTSIIFIVPEVQCTADILVRPTAAEDFTSPT